MNIILQSGIDACGVYKKYWKWIGGISGLITLLSYIQQNIFSDKKWWFYILLACSIAPLLVIYIYYLFINFIYWIHKKFTESIWGEAIRDLAYIYSIVHELERNDNKTDQEYAKTLSSFCNSVKKIFDRITNSNCCVSIKVPIVNYSDCGKWGSMHVKNFARDQRHLSERDTPEYTNATHSILDNTAYSRVISLVMSGTNKPKVYLNNDVTNDPNYATSSINCGRDQAVIYKSELVVPIIPTKYKNLNSIIFGGFLCIDSNQKGAFHMNGYEIPMVIGLADGLYSLIITLINK